MCVCVFASLCVCVSVCVRVLPVYRLHQSFGTLHSDSSISGICTPARAILRLAPLCINLLDVRKGLKYSESRMSCRLLHIDL